jgi:hypothetical protein
MTTYTTNTAVVYPDGTAQYTASVSTPHGDYDLPGIYETTWNGSDRWNNTAAQVAAGLANGYFGAGGKSCFYRSMLGSKPVGVTLTNTTGRAILVWATSAANRHPSNVWIHVNGIEAAISGGDHDEGWATSGTMAVVPHGATYLVSGNNNGVANSISGWFELSL